MTVNFEILSNEPIENVITCMHFKVDKVVYFGYHGMVQSMRECTEAFLRKYCGVQTVVFHELSRNDLQSVLNTMRKEIQYELGRNSKIYFDITGGASLILVAFGMLKNEFRVPMHIYDIPADRLIELDEAPEKGISKELEARKTDLDLEKYIEMRGGIINEKLYKSIKENLDDEFSSDVLRIWKVAGRYIDCWNPFSEFLRRNMVPEDDLTVNRRMQAVLNALSSSGTRLRTLKKLNKIVDDLAKEGILQKVVRTDDRYSFRFKNRLIKDCLWEGGSILELYTFLTQKKDSEDCKAGVHLDWDGVIHPQRGIDVMNEIDVLSLKGNIPTFISCKSGRMGAQQTLHALYELDTVAKRFGGKYAKKVLVSAKDIKGVYLERAEEMGIEVRNVLQNDKKKSRKS